MIIYIYWSRLGWLVRCEQKWKRNNKKRKGKHTPGPINNKWINNNINIAQMIRNLIVYYSSNVCNAFNFRTWGTFVYITNVVIEDDTNKSVLKRICVKNYASRCVYMIDLYHTPPHAPCHKKYMRFVVSSTLILYMRFIDAFVTQNS